MRSGVSTKVAVPPNELTRWQHAVGFKAHCTPLLAPIYRTPHNLTTRTYTLKIAEGAVSPTHHQPTTPTPTRKKKENALAWSDGLLTRHISQTGAKKLVLLKVHARHDQEDCIAISQNPVLRDASSSQRSRLNQVKAQTSRPKHLSPHTCTPRPAPPSPFCSELVEYSRFA